MTATLEEYYEDFENSVRTRAVASSRFLQHAFVEEMSERLSDADQIDALIPCAFEGVGAKNRKLLLSGYDFGDEDGQIVLAVADYRPGQEIQTLATADARKLVSAAEAFAVAAIEGSVLSTIEESLEAYQVAWQIHEMAQRIGRIRIYLLTNAQLGERLKELPTSSIGSISVEYHLWSIDRLQRVQLSQSGREPIDIDLTQWEARGIPALAASGAEASLATYLVSLPGKLLADIYEVHGSRLLEANVRSFLSSRSKVNAGIRGTVLQDPELFLPYNNGISATASSVTFDMIDGAVRLSTIRDLQIVNGGQTTATLFYSKRNDKADLSRVYVQMKLIVVDDAAATELVPKISRFANTQNRVSEADFFSNHPFHQRMEEKSRRILAPAQAGVHVQTKWFYERARGQYLNEKARRSPAEAKRFEVEYPKSQVITKTDAAKFLVSWDQKPHLVSAGAQANFKAFAAAIAGEWLRAEDQFGDDFFRELVAKGILFHGIRQRAQKAAWYGSGYLANIVTYSMSKLSYDIPRQWPGYSLDFAAIWKTQGIPSQLDTAIEAVSYAVFQALTDSKRPVVNVTEWAKREACWDRVRELSVPLPDTLEGVLVDSEARVERKHEAKKTQRIDSGIAAQVEVLELGSHYWYNLRRFGEKMKAISPKELSILRTATGEAGHTPSEAQAKVLLDLRTRLESLGYVGN